MKQISISGGANGYGPLAVGWGRPQERCEIQCEFIENLGKTKGPAFALAPFLLRHCLAQTVSRMRKRFPRMYQNHWKTKQIHHFRGRKRLRFLAHALGKKLMGVGKVIGETVQLKAQLN